MPPEKSQIHINRFLEYAIFTRAPLNIQPLDQFSERLMLRIVSCDEKTFCAQIKDNISGVDLVRRWNGISLEATMGYKSAGLTFKTKVVVIREEGAIEPKSDSWVVFEKPEKASLSNKRPSLRLGLNNSALTLVAELETYNGPVKIVSTNLRDISVSAISFWIRSEEPCPRCGSRVRRLDLLKNQKLVMSCSGTVLKTAVPNHGNSLDLRLVIVQLTSPAGDLVQKRRRITERVVLLDRFNRAYIDFSFPLVQGEHVYGHVADISEQGILFEIPNLEKPLSPGMLFEDATILLPYHSPRQCIIQIVHCRTILRKGMLYSRAGGVFIRSNSSHPTWIREAISYIDSRQDYVLDPQLTVQLTDSEQPITGTFHANTVHGQKKITVKRCIAFSSDWIEVQVNRADALLLPGDDILDIALVQGGNPVLRGKGIIQSSDYSVGFEDSSDSYNVRVAMVQNASPAKRERNHLRAAMASGATCAYVEFVHPWVRSQTLYGHVTDLSAEGMAFVVARNPVPLVVGMVISEMAIQLPYQKRFKISFEVVSCVPTTGGIHGYRIGGKLDQPNQHQILQISQSVQEFIDGHLTDITLLDHERLWELFFESGFIYGTKREQIDRYTEKIFLTHARLLTCNPPFLKKIVYRSDGVISGHISGLQFFDHGWLAQHLTANNVDNGMVARAVLYGFIDGFLAPHKNVASKTDYLCFFYREESLFPSVVFGGIQEKTNDREICDSKEFDFCLANLYYRKCGNSKKDSGRFRCHEVTGAELGLVEQAALATEEYHYFRLEGLSRETILRQEISKEYQAIGLYRFRKVFAAVDQQTGRTCFAVCNFASPGLNFSELTNSWRMYFWGNGIASSDQDLVNMLGSFVIDAYKTTEMPEPVLLLTPALPCPDSFTTKKRYTYLYFDLRYISTLRLAIGEVFDDFKKHVRAHVRSQEHRAAT